MRFRKSLAFTFALLLTFFVCAAPFCCSAAVTTSAGKLNVLVGNTRSRSPVYNYAWLDTVIVRDDAMAFTPSEMVPRDNYPYSLTLDEFISESEQYMELFDLDVDSVSDIFFGLLRTVYYTVIALGFSNPDYQVMYDYLRDYGINYTSSDADLNLLYTTVLYSCIKNNAYYVLYGKQLTVPKGITLEHAAVIYLAETLGIELPSGIDTVTGLSLLVMRSYIADSGLPISPNPDKYEAFYWAKIAVASAQEYKVPTVAFNEATAAQLEYVDYAYCSAIIKLKYDVTVNPLKLYSAMTGTENYAVQKLILKTMLDEKSVAYSKDASVQQLFEAACKAGYFALENEFYTDVYSYDVTVGMDSEKLWLSPFALAPQLENGSADALSITLNGIPVKHASTTGIDLDRSKTVQTVTIDIKYTDTFRSESATYVFNVYRSSVPPTTTSVAGDLVGTIESYISSALPADNANAQQRVSEAFESVRDAVNAVTQDSNGSLISTYPINAATTARDEHSSAQASGSLFTTYPTSRSTSNIDAYTRFTTYPAEQPTSVFSNALTAMANNPAATATPISLIAIGAAVGLIFNKRRKDSLAAEEADDGIFEDSEE